MGIERRRSPRYPVTGVKGLIHVSFSARSVSLEGETLTLEAARQLRVGRSYIIGAMCNDQTAARLIGTVKSCRLTGVRTGAAGNSTAVYESLVSLQKFSPDSAEVLPSHLLEPLNIDAAYEATARVLNAYGALVESELELMIGSSCRVEWFLEKSKFTSMASVVFLHQIKQGEGSAYHLGVEYHHTPAESREVLDRYLATLAS